MVISKERAAQIAELLIQPKQKEITEIEKLLKDELTKIVESAVPEDVKKLWDDNSKFLNYATYVTLRKYGFNHDSFSLSKPVPASDHGDFDISKEDAKTIKSIQNQIKDLKVSRDKLRIEIKQSLLQLKTVKNISEHFPEAAKHLPASNTLAITIDLNKVRNQLK